MSIDDTNVKNVDFFDALQPLPNDKSPFVSFLRAGYHVPALGGGLFSPNPRQAMTLTAF